MRILSIKRIYKEIESSFVKLAKETKEITNNSKMGERLFNTYFASRWVSLYKRESC